MIQKFRKKPVVIDAFFPSKENVPIQLVSFVECFGEKFDDHFKFIDQGPDGASLQVRTLEGTSYDVQPDIDVIIRGINGEYYPCKREIFNKTYEPVI